MVSRTCRRSSGRGVRGGNRLPSGLEPGCAVAAGWLASFLTGPACLCFDPAADGEVGLRFRVTLVAGCGRLAGRVRRGGRLAGSGKAVGGMAAGGAEADREAAELRGAMAGQVAERCQAFAALFPGQREPGEGLPGSVVAALRKVPRHLFTPGVPLARAYEETRRPPRAGEGSAARPGGPHAVRYASVDAAAQRPTAWRSFSIAAISSPEAACCANLSYWFFVTCVYSGRGSGVTGSLLSAAVTQLSC